MEEEEADFGIFVELFWYIRNISNFSVHEIYLSGIFDMLRQIPEYL